MLHQECLAAKKTGTEQAMLLQHCHWPFLMIRLRAILKRKANEIWRLFLYLYFFKFQDKCYQYWPEDRSERYQYFVVDPMKVFNMPQYILREFKVRKGF